MTKIILFSLVLSGVVLNVSNAESNVITFPSLGDLGSAKGLVGESAWTRKVFYSFRDLRYAEAPIGQLRFKSTPIFTKFEEEPYDATHFRRPCVALSTVIPQNSTDEEILDCLYLSIHTSKMLAQNSVMVYLTGFDLLHGSNQEVDPRYFMDKNIVLVSVQYRLGVFGFLNAETQSIPGNAAIRDILTALKWIQKYIVWFGGNPRSVTLVGQYKVAGLIQALTMIPEADGLFHQVICQSGSVFTQNIMSLTTAPLSIKFGITLGCPNLLNRKKLSDCLLGVNMNELNGVFREHVQNLNGNVGLVTIGGVNGLLPYFPYDLQHDGIIRPYPMIIGTVENPATYLLDAYFNEILSIFSSNRTNLIDGLGLSKVDYEKYRLKGIADQDKQMRKNLKSGLELNHGKTYVYLFKYHGAHHYFKRKSGNPLQDVTLLDDKIYFFPYPDLVQPNDMEISKILINLWTNFAKNGVPTTDEIKEWPPFEPNITKYLVIDSTVRVEDDFQKYEVPVIVEQ